MGQGESTSKDASSLMLLQERLQKHASELKQAATITYEQFLSSLEFVNKITMSFSDISGKQLVFQVKESTDASVLWKGTIRIKCHKMNGRTGAYESTRVLNLKQYMRLYNEITKQAAMATLQSDGGEGASALSASVILTELDVKEELQESECCICMDRKAVVILPCSHLYCEQCIDQWSVSHQTCPICRAAVKGSDDTWVLTEKPDKCEMAYETTGYLMGLADRTGSPEQSSSDD